MGDIIQVMTDKAPKPRGPYSQAVRAGSYLFVAGQVPLDPKTGLLVRATIEEQTHQVLDNIEAILSAAGLTLQHVVKVEIYLKDLDDAHAMNTVYTQRFSHPIKPARVTVQVSHLPLHALIEISCIAFVTE